MNPPVALPATAFSGPFALFSRNAPIFPIFRNSGQNRCAALLELLHCRLSAAHLLLNEWTGRGADAAPRPV
ncbi:hypothetical protein DTW90_12985 [Neorhizobium sp. P12A]|nr:hypothetical protein DTW90_12985 [Neorhizobium sp. P12A]